MKRTISLFLVFFFFFSITPVCYAAADDVPFSDNPKAIQVASNSVIMLSCYDKDGNLYSTGSAFAAFEEGVFVTNCHVIKNEIYSIQAQMETGLEFSISTVVAYDDERDLAILRTEAKTGLEPLALGSSAELEKGEKVIAIGSPLGLINTLSIGLYSGTLKNEQSFLQFSAAISHGSSGGALFNNNGEVVGITSASFTEGQNLNLAIPIEDAVELWEKHEDPTELSIPEFYDLWEHIKQYSVSYLLSHKSAFNRGSIIQTEGYVFFDPYSTRKNRYYVVETLSDYSDICKALEELNSYGGALSNADVLSAQFGSASDDIAETYEVQKKYETVLEKTALLVSSYKQEGVVEQGEYVIIKGEIVESDGIPHLKNVSIIQQGG